VTQGLGARGTVGFFSHGRFLALSSLKQPLAGNFMGNAHTQEGFEPTGVLRSSLVETQ